MSCAFLYDPQLSQYQLSDAHPFKPLRLELTRDLLLELGLLGPQHERAVERMNDRLLTRVHDPDYVNVVRAVSKGKAVSDAFGYGLGTGDNPIFPNMHEAVLRVCDATVTAVDLVASGTVQRAVNLSGGLHHALRDKASGFCVYNDLALGIEHAVQQYGTRVAYIDLDAHHGDGVQWLFFDRADVMTISMHESGRYLFPGTGHTFEVGQGEGRGLSVNVPLEPFTEDASFMACFEAVVPQALEVFRPDLIVLQAGADMHRLDPLADLSLTSRGFARSYQRVSELADLFCEGRLVATGGGGYDPYRTVPRIWALLWAAVSRQAISDEVPAAWRARWQAQSPQELPEELHDPTSWNPVPRQNEISSHNRAVVQRVLSSLTPIWQERFGYTGRHTDSHTENPTESHKDKGAS
jgi:acetoin utilization protein AcuC